MKSRREHFDNSSCDHIAEALKDSTRLELRNQAGKRLPDRRLGGYPRQTGKAAVPDRNYQVCIGGKDTRIDWTSYRHFITES
jgi:hypothetical protein